MEVFAVIALLILVWMTWQLYRAKQYTRFKHQIQTEIKPKVISAIQTQLQNAKSEITPNNDCHIQASINYWCQYPVRIMQYALTNEVIDKDWLTETGNYRNCQHLYHVQRPYLHQFKNQEANDS